MRSTSSARCRYCSLPLQRQRLHSAHSAHRQYHAHACRSRRASHDYSAPHVLSLVSIAVGATEAADKADAPQDADACNAARCRVSWVCALKTFRQVVPLRLLTHSCSEKYLSVDKTARTCTIACTRKTIMMLTACSSKSNYLQRAITRLVRK